MKTFVSTNINIDKLKTKCASLLPLKEQLIHSSLSLNIGVNLETTQIKIEIEVHAA